MTLFQPQQGVWCTRWGMPIYQGLFQTLEGSWMALAHCHRHLRVVTVMIMVKHHVCFQQSPCQLLVKMNDPASASNIWSLCRSRCIVVLGDIKLWPVARWLWYIELYILALLLHWDYPNTTLTIIITGQWQSIWCCLYSHSGIVFGVQVQE